jgi:hypothetical protein
MPVLALMHILVVNSLGCDAELSYTVEMHRKPSRWLNRMMYLFTGIFNVFR